MTEQRQLNKKLNVQRFNAFQLTMALCTIVDSNKLRLIKQACQNAQTARDQESEDTATQRGSRIPSLFPFSLRHQTSLVDLRYLKIKLTSSEFHIRDIIRIMALGWFATCITGVFYLVASSEHLLTNFFPTMLS